MLVDLYHLFLASRARDNGHNQPGAAELVLWTAFTKTRDARRSLRRVGRAAAAGYVVAERRCSCGWDVLVTKRRATSDGPATPRGRFRGLP